MKFIIFVATITQNRNIFIAFCFYLKQPCCRCCNYIDTYTKYPWSQNLVLPERFFHFGLSVHEIISCLAFKDDKGMIGFFSWWEGFSAADVERTGRITRVPSISFFMKSISIVVETTTSWGRNYYRKKFFLRYFILSLFVIFFGWDGKLNVSPYMKVREVPSWTWIIVWQSYYFWYKGYLK